MKQTLILDFMGVVADINYIKLILEMPLKHKFSTLRIFLSLKKCPEIKIAFRKYQLGQIDSRELQEVVAKVYPNSAYVVPLILEALSQNIKVNEDVLEMIKLIQEKGAQVLLMSNTIPETEGAIESANLHETLDGIMLSTELGLKKPGDEIFEYAIKTFDLSPETTVMIDDTKKNLEAAKKFGFTTIRCKNSKETLEVLRDYLVALDIADSL